MNIYNHFFFNVWVRHGCIIRNNIWEFHVIWKKQKPYLYWKCFLMPLDNCGLGCKCCWAIAIWTWDWSGPLHYKPLPINQKCDLLACAFPQKIQCVLKENGTRRMHKRKTKLILSTGMLTLFWSVFMGFGMGPFY